ncbi:MAG: membrane protein insertase YidC [Chloroflexi bacterium]|nr:MAG: membrane protein insertase YidC [Chloroflexota bacterium]
MPIGLIWQTALETPLINFMIALSRTAFDSYGLAILLFTVLTRVVTFPLTLRTLHAMKSMQVLQPLLAEVQKKYTDPRRRSEETMKLYKEHGVNPLGCLGPQLVQIPIFIALYATIRLTIGSTPEAMLYLSSRLYDIEYIRHAIPLSTSFLGMDLAENGSMGLAAFVFVGMWVQQRISTSRASTTPGSQQAQMNQMMQWFMPIFFGWFFVLTLPAALGLYWGASTAIGVILQWIFVGPGDFHVGELIPRNLPWGSSTAGGTSAVSTTRRTSNAAPRGGTESGDDDANHGSEREDSRGGSGPGTGSTGPGPRTGRRRRNPRR